MKNAMQRKGLKLAGGVLIGGLGAGLLMAMAVPTSMKQQGEGWRDMLGLRDVSPETTPVLAFEAPPEDLTPVSWHPASEEYPAAVPQDQYLDLPDNFGADMPDGNGPLLSEPQSTPLLATNYSSRDTTTMNASPVDTSDAAGSSAEAARNAAADVRTAEVAAVQPASADASIETGASTATPDTAPVAIAAPS